jgi:heme/copper-type cytochrome/quinol oxidase subunit 4
MNLLFLFSRSDLILIALFGVLLPVVALIHILTGKFEQNDKLIWVIVVLFIPLLGSIVYFLSGRKNRKKTS